MPAAVRPASQRFQGARGWDFRVVALHRSEHEPHERRVQESPTGLKLQILLDLRRI